jgi:hypothetical protein
MSWSVQAPSVGETKNEWEALPAPDHVQTPKESLVNIFTESEQEDMTWEEAMQIRVFQAFSNYKNAQNDKA